MADEEKSCINWETIDGYRFQELCMDLLAVDGFDVQDRGVGPDGGVDAILLQVMRLPDKRSQQLRWAAQFKYKQRADATVKPTEIGNIVNILTRYHAEGFFLITNGRVTDKALAELHGVTSVCHPPYLLSVWMRRQIEEKIITCPQVGRRYFPTLAPSAWQPTVTVEITLDLPFEQFSGRERNMLRYSLARLLDIPVTAVKFKNVLTGSTKVIVELPVESAQLLQAIFEGGLLALEAYGFQHTVLSIRKAEPLGEEVATENLPRDATGHSSFPVMVQGSSLLEATGASATPLAYQTIMLPEIPWIERRAERPAQNLLAGGGGVEDGARIVRKNAGIFTLRTAVRAITAGLPWVGGAFQQIWSEQDNYERLRIEEELLEELGRLRERPSETAIRHALRLRLKSIGEGEKSRGQLERTGGDKWRKLLREVLEYEIPRQLQSVDPTSGYRLGYALKRLTEDGSFASRLHSLRSGSQTFLHDASRITTDIYSAPTKILGFQHESDDSVRSISGIRIAFPAFMVGIAAILFHLRYIRQADIELQYRFAHAIELSERIVDHTISPDACVFGDAAALGIIGRARRPSYRFALLLPQIEERLVRIKSPWYRKRGAMRGRLIYIADADKPSTTLFQVEHLERAGYLKRERFEEISREPHESVDILQTGDPETYLALWAPLWQIYDRLKVGESIEDSAFLFDTLLFLRESLLARRRGTANALLAAIRRSWIKLLQPEALALTIDRMLAEQEYVDKLFHYCGLHTFEKWTVTK